MSNKDPATIKTRHYAALAASLRQLNTNLAQSEGDYQRLAERLQAMQRLGAYHAAQYGASVQAIPSQLTADSWPCHVCSMSSWPRVSSKCRKRQGGRRANELPAIQTCIVDLRTSGCTL
jgi:hypothetical protein